MDIFREGLDHCVQFLIEERIIPDDERKRKLKRHINDLRMDLWKLSMRDDREYPTTEILAKSLYEIYALDSIPAEILTQLGDIYHHPERTCWSPFKDTITLLEDLAAGSIKLGVLSNHPHDPFIRTCLDQFDLSRFFTVIHTSAEFGVRKPGKEAFQKALKGLQVAASPERCVMVGDDANADIFGAKRLGMRAILMHREFKFPFQSRKTAEPDAKIRKISEILPIIYQWSCS